MIIRHVGLRLWCFLVLFFLHVALSRSSVFPGKRDFCGLAPDRGPCTASLPRFYYDETLGICAYFAYGGCAGNANNFRNEISCLRTCTRRENPCSLPPDVGPCRAYLKRYFYDARVAQCKTFIYGGCGGNANNFATLQECFQKCGGAKNLKNTGPTSGSMVADSDGESARTFTFFEPNSFALLGDKQFGKRGPLSFSFRFRTQQCSGLLYSHVLTDGPGILPDGEGEFDYSYAYMSHAYLDMNGVTVVHSFLHHTEAILLPFSGLCDDQWHDMSVTVMLKGSTPMLEVTVDLQSRERMLASLENAKIEHYTPFLFLGGMSEEWVKRSRLPPSNFIGCLGDVVLDGKQPPLVISDTTLHGVVANGCIDRCQEPDVERQCLHGGKCVNQYSRFSCDCKNSPYEGKFCELARTTTLRFRGDSYLSVNLEPMTASRLTLEFKTSVKDSMLFYTRGKGLLLALAFKNGGELTLTLKLGDVEVNGKVVGAALADDQWHTLELNLNGMKNVLSVSIDGKEPEREYLPPVEKARKLIFDSRLFIGGSPYWIQTIDKKPNFQGCLRNVFVDHRLILEGHEESDPSVRYVGPRIEHCGPSEDAEPSDSDPPSSSVTIHRRNAGFVLSAGSIPSADSVPWTSSDVLVVHLEFQFPKRDDRDRKETLVWGQFRRGNQGNGSWTVSLAVDRIQLDLKTNDQTLPLFTMEVGKDLKPRTWHALDLSYLNGEVSLTLDDRFKEIVSFPPHVEFLPVLHVGYDPLLQDFGFVGCVRNVLTGGKEVDLEGALEGRDPAEVSYGECNLCEGDQPSCECRGTAHYDGKTCQFARWKESCSDLAELDRETGLYRVDPDGPGPFPSVVLQCDIHDDHALSVAAVVHHNLPPNTVIREAGLYNHMIPVEYRDFDDRMLQRLIAQSIDCEQKIAYGCVEAPLDLGTATWFTSAQRNKVNALRNDGYGCPCHGNNCAPDDGFCSCDSSSPLPETDWTILNRTRNVGITEIYALNDPAQKETAKGDVSLGPLICHQHEREEEWVTFSSQQSFLPISKQSINRLRLSFRTDQEQGILLSLPFPSEEEQAFILGLTSGTTLSLNYPGGSESIESPETLSDGREHVLWLDFGGDQVRLTVGLQLPRIFNVSRGLPTFFDQVFLGGTPSSVLEPHLLLPGFLGCLGDLTLNGDRLNPRRHATQSHLDILPGCRASCASSPCQNGAVCVERWGSHECKCLNPVAHFGKNCENNLNADAVTFGTPEAHHRSLWTEADDAKAKAAWRRIFTGDIQFAFRTHQRTALLLYADDDLGNFVQIHLEEGSGLLFTFNSNRTIVAVRAGSTENLSTGKEVQVQVKREKDSVTLLVNKQTAKTYSWTVLLDEPLGEANWTNQVNVQVIPHSPFDEKPSFLADALLSWMGVSNASSSDAPSPSPYVRLFLGGVDEKEMETDIPGFVGCLAGLKIGRTLPDFTLSSIPGSLGAWGSMRAGCYMKCDTEPCKNDGFCIEDFAIENSYTCDCSLSSYKGLTCEQDSGLTFEKTSKGITKDIPEHKLSHVEYTIKLAFSTAQSEAGGDRVLLFLAFGNWYIHKGAFVLIELTAKNELMVSLDFGDGVAASSVVSPEFTDGFRHSVLLRRPLFEPKGLLLVDGQEVPLKYDVSSLPMEVEGKEVPEDEDAKEQKNAVYLASGPAGDPRFERFVPYEGCLSNVEVIFPGYSIDIIQEFLEMKNGEPLEGMKESACGSPPSRRGNGHQEPNSRSGDVHLSLQPVNIQWDPPGLHRMILTGLGDERTEESEDMNHTESNVAAWMLGTLMVVLVSLSIFFIYRKRQRREEVARGGRGAKRAKVPEEGWDDEDGEHAIYTGPPPDLKKPQLDHPFKKSQYSPLPREPPQLTDETSLNGGDSEKPSVTGKGSQSELEWDNQELNAPGNLVTRDEDSEDDEVFEGDNRGTLRMDEMQSRRQFED